MLIAFTPGRAAAALADVLAVFVPHGKLAAAIADVDAPDAFAGALAGAARDDGFEGRAGTSFWSPGLGKVAAKRVMLIGCGGGTPGELRAAAGLVGNQSRNKSARSVAIVCSEAAMGANALSLTIEAFAEGNYRFDKYKPAGQRKAPTDTLTYVGVQEDSATVAAALALAAGQELARNLVNEPAAEIHPDSIAAIAEGLAGPNVSVVASLGFEAIVAKGMGGIAGVGQGSDKKPRFVHLRYEPPGGAKAHVALVGKGVTFDSGGLSIKPNDGMLTMRCDMAGAAAVIGAMRAISELKPNVRVDVIFGAVENMPSGNSYKLGDILKMYSGKRVEIHNTDAEGRLVLADCLHYASELKPDVVVDLATLTGAAVVALGDWYSALYSREDSVAAGLLAAADTCGEAAWRMPLPDLYRDKIKAEWGETKNTGGRSAGSITAALFLSDFVTTPKWAHIDIAGPAFLDSALLHYVQGGTGTMVRTLCRWIGGLGA
ncbi:putative cytosol aminopeptidase [Deltaproteobacteria bacterium]|nr:putative cytosol aminopeptidase [Deltaproteobacteria bacterium]